MLLKTIAAAAVSATLMFAGSASAQTMEWTAGQIGGGWYSQAAGMAKLIQEKNPGIRLKVVPGGGTANPLKVARNVSQFGMGLDIFLQAAYEGKFLYDEPHDNLRLLGGSFSDIYLHMIAADNAPYQDMDKLFREGKDVEISVTKAGSSDEQTFRYLMEYYGTDYDTLRDERGWKINHLDYAASASQFADGQVDYAFHALGLPGASVVEMTQARDASLMEWPQDLVDKLHETYGYAVADIPEGTYENAQDGAVTTIKMGTPIMVNSETPEDVVYKATKTLCENQDQLVSIHASMSVFDCKTAGDTTPAPLHPGAKRYYEEQGYLDD